MKKNEKISVIVVNHNGLKWLNNCFESVFSQDYPNLEVIMVDNASIDESVIYVSKNFPNVQIIKNNKNLGLSKGNNMAANEATGEILFFLNSDVKLGNSLISLLVEFMISNYLDIVGPQILNYEGEYVFNGKFFSIDRFGYPNFYKNMFFLQGSAIMIKKNVFNDIGRFDEKYFLYAEDIDLCFKARIMGFKIGQCSNAYVNHNWSNSLLGNLEKKRSISKLNRYELEKNIFRTIIKNIPASMFIYSFLGFIVLNFFESFLYILIFKPKMCYLMQKAIWWNVINLGDVLRERKTIQEKRIISDEEIKKLMIPGSVKIKLFFKFGIPKFK